MNFFSVFLLGIFFVSLFMTKILEFKFFSASITSLRPTPIPAKLMISPILTSVLIPTKTPTLTPVFTIVPARQTFSAFSPTPGAYILDKTEFVMNEINNYRVSLGLFRFKTDNYTCDFAYARAGELASNFSHEGFNNRLDNKTLPYPSYAFITENIAINSDYRNVAKSWIDSIGHAVNLQKNAIYACVGNSGDYYTFESWKP